MELNTHCICTLNNFSCVYKMFQVILHFVQKVHKVIKILMHFISHIYDLILNFTLCNNIIIMTAAQDCFREVRRKSQRSFLVIRCKNELKDCSVLINDFINSY